MKTYLKLLLIYYGSTIGQSVTIDPKSTNSVLIETKSTSKGILVTKMTQSERGAISAPVAGTMIFCTDCVTGIGNYSYNGTTWVSQFTASVAPTYSLGQSIFGGKIFYIDDTGQHGLVAAPADLAADAAWFNGNYTNTQAVRLGLYGGYANTSLILNSQKTGDYAAINATKDNSSSYGDWFLPSVEELKRLYDNRVLLGGFSSAVYWSSSEIAVASNSVCLLAKAMNFGTGAILDQDKSLISKIRPIRQF